MATWRALNCVEPWIVDATREATLTSEFAQCELGSSGAVADRVGVTFSAVAEGWVRAPVDGS